MSDQTTPDEPTPGPSAPEGAAAGTAFAAQPAEATSATKPAKRYTTVKPGRFGWWKNGLAATVVRALFFLAAVGLGFVLLESPWNEDLSAIAPDYVLANLAILGLLCAVVFLAGQRTRASLALFVGLCLAAGLANFYIIAFKGQPILPADMFALSTAAAVAGGYQLFLTPHLAACIALYAVFCAALGLLCPARRLTPGSVAVNCVAAVLVAGFCVAQYQGTNIREEYNVTVDVWDVNGSYGTQGTALCFLSRMQELTPEEPEGYSDEAVARILGPYQKDDAAEDGEDFKGPNVIAIMNETFSDLSQYPGLEGTAAGPTYYQEVAADSLAAGTMYVSAMGGGTCNSEFEFLTGSSMGNMGGGVYPYVLYDLDGVDNLAAYFRKLGYDTHAIHPAEASNWRRDRVYEQLGFDTFDDITTMEGADTFRNLPTDRATYERVLQKIDEGDGPQFVFDVTIQNHGGYDTGLVPEADKVHVDAGAASSAELDEFEACLRRSEEDLRWLIDQLNQRDEPCILVFFGDHQPGFVDELFKATYGKSVDDASLEEVQTRYNTPYFIWANAAARADDSPTQLRTLGTDVACSLNYLGDMLVSAAGLPATMRSQYQDDLSEALPAVNLNGYMDATGAWHWFGEEVTTQEQQAAEDALKDYRIVQYDDLFNPASAYHETN